MRSCDHFQQAFFSNLQGNNEPEPDLWGDDEELDDVGVDLSGNYWGKVESKPIFSLAQGLDSVAIL
jgi:hypothetical protein